jgi:putative heme-binding domain-containing protein
MSEDLPPDAETFRPAKSGDAMRFDWHRAAVRRYAHRMTIENRRHTLGGMRAATVALRACVTAFAAAPRTAALAGGPQTAGQSKDEILAAQTKDDKSGDPAAGRKAFDERCAACHRFGAIGKDVGPDLTTIASRFKRRDVLEAILWPSKVLSDQYVPEIFELKDGTIVSGLIIRESATAVLVRTSDNPDKPAVVTKSQIANRSASTVSLMPEGLQENLSASQLADLLAFVLAPPPEK